TAKVGAQFGQFTLEQQQFFLGAAGTSYVVEVNFFQLFHPLNTFGNSGEVGEHTAQPTMVYVWHANTCSLLNDRALSLPLGAHKGNSSTVRNGFFDELIGTVNERQGLLQVNNINAIAFCQDKTLHLRVPATCLVAEVDTGIQHFPQGYDSHLRSSSSRHGR